MAKADLSRRPEPLSSNIERMMEDHDPPLNPRALAISAGINEWGVRDILKGKSQNPQHSTIEKIAAAGGWSVGRLTGKMSETHAQLVAEISDMTADEIRATVAYIRSLKATRTA